MSGSSLSGIRTGRGTDPMPKRFPARFSLVMVVRPEALRSNEAGKAYGFLKKEKRHKNKVFETEKMRKLAVAMGADNRSQE